jgi:hypothetical protein
VFRATTSLLVLTPIRLGLAAAGFVAAALVGGAPAAGFLVAFGTGAVASAVVLSADPRLARNGETVALPADARVMTLVETAAYGVMPSTVGVAVLMVTALFFNAVLAALLAGVEAGMGVMGFVSWLNLDAAERREGRRLYVERGGRRLFEAPRP